jgi:hypothetical protein
MATVKKEGRLAGKAIRRATGLPLPIAQRIGKFQIGGRLAEAVNHPAFAGAVRRVAERCSEHADCACGVHVQYVACGPRGEEKL